MPIMPYEKAGKLGQSNQLISGEAVRPSDIFDSLRQAQKAWFAACQEFVRVSSERERALSELRNLTEQANKVMQEALLDPMSPSVGGQIPTSSNGRW